MYLFVPYICIDKHKNVTSGYGHLIRCLRALCTIGGSLYIPKEVADVVKHILVPYKKKYKLKHKKELDIVHGISKEYSVIILDKREADKYELLQYLYYAPVIGIDLGGEAREYASYLIDTLPNLYKHSPNAMLSGSHMGDEIKRKKECSRVCKHILMYSPLSNSEEDSLILKIEQEMLCNLGSRHSALQISVLTNNPNLYTDIEKKYKNIQIKKFDINIMESIEKYDLFLSHFGISIYEALSAKLPVIVLNRTNYHHSLSDKAGFPKTFLVEAQSNQESIRKTYQRLQEFIDSLVADEQAYAQFCKEMASIQDYEDILSRDKSQNLATHIEEIVNNYKKSAMTLAINPWIGITLEKAIFRNKQKTIFECEHTQQYHQLSFSDAFPSYDESYFFEEFEKQYGSTYIENFSQILALMRQRMKIMDKILSSKGKKTGSIVDIGCAYGAMLHAISEYSYNSLGLEINKNAVEYCKQVILQDAIKLDIQQESLVDVLKKSKKLEQKPVVAISAFYVIEHISNLQKFLSEVQKILPVDGLFACSVPNGNGISIRKSKKNFFEESPIDHFSIFTPKGLKKLLEKSGFTVRKIRVTGHHPERIIPYKSLSNIILIISKIFKLGDTFEIYATKQWSPEYNAD